MFALLLLVAAGCARAEGRPVNLLLVTMDAVRADRFDAPERFSELPLALAAFSAEATRFTGLVASAPETLPAVASILTGRHPRELGHPAPDRLLPSEIATLAEILSHAGFDTAAFVAPASLRPETGIARGFSTYVSPGGLRDEDYEVTDRARDWLLEPARRERRWFLWVHLNAAHGPYRALESAFAPLKVFYRSSVPPERGRERRIPFATGNSGTGGVPDYQTVRAPALFGAYRSYYDARVKVGDWFANELRHVLKITGQYADTVIVVSGTHGEALGEHGVEFDHAEDLFREGLEAPLLVRVPGRAPSVVAGTVSHVDVFPTLLAALGLPAREASGRDLFAGGSGFALSEIYPPIGPAVAIALTAGSRKLIRSDVGVLEFDLHGDPAEQHGFAPRPEDDLARRLAALAEKPVAEVERLELDSRERTRLHGLGYVLSRFDP